MLESEPELIARLWDNTRFFKSGLQTLGFNTGVSESPITPVIVGEAALAMKLSDALFQEGVFAQGIGFPTVARDRRASARSSPPRILVMSFSSRSIVSDGWGDRLV